MKLDLLTNATVVDDAIKFVSSKSKQNLKSSIEDDKEESNEPDYHEQQVEQIGETPTTNQVFQELFGHLAVELDEEYDDDMEVGVRVCVSPE